MLDNIMKWSATVLLIVGFWISSYSPELYPLGPGIQLLGGIVWLIVSVRWREPALIVTNGVMSTVGIVGLTANLFG